MKLFSNPNSPACGTLEDRVEWKYLKDMYRASKIRDNAAYLECSKALTVLGVSRISVALVFIVGEPLGPSAERLTFVANAVEDLIAIRDGAAKGEKSRWVDHWMNFLVEWIGKGFGVQSKL